MKTIKSLLFIFTILVIITCQYSLVYAQDKTPLVYFNFTFSLPNKIANSITKADSNKNNLYINTDNEKEADIVATAFLLSYPNNKELYLAISMVNLKTNKVFKAFDTIPMDTFGNIFNTYIDPTISKFVKDSNT